MTPCVAYPRNPDTAPTEVKTKQRIETGEGFEQAFGKEKLASRTFHIIQTGKKGLVAFIHELGVMIGEVIMYMERVYRLVSVRTFMFNFVLASVSRL